MSTSQEKAAHVTEPNTAAKQEPESQGRTSSRREFLGRAGIAATAAGILGTAPATLARASTAFAEPPPSNRLQKALALRIARAQADAAIPVPPHTTNGDEQRYADHSASYSKCLLQDDIGVVNPSAWSSFKHALNSGFNDDFEAMIMGGARAMNDPQGSYAFDLEALDSEQFGNAHGHGDPHGPILVPPFARIDSADYGTQLVEMYWASLLRDVAFTDYRTNTTANAAAAELSTMPAYRGPRDCNGNVTTELLFRGAFPGETVGPYISQLLIAPTLFGVQPLSQQLITYLPNINYMTDLTTFFQIQNGISTGLSNQIDPVLRYLHDGRGLGAYTHVDVLYQAYFTAMLVLLSLRLPLNPGNPYAGSKTQVGFSTFGGPDFAASVGEIAARALNKVWYQKWLVHLVHRPEAGGGVVQQILSGNQNKIDARLHSNVLNSQAVAQSFIYNNSGTWLLSQAFPEGSPSHPSYPTGHGTVGGACITLLKFFFDGNQPWPNPLVPSNDGLSLDPYAGSDGEQMTVNGELNKLAHNVSFGHGIHAGIHWRQDSDQSLLLGEAIALSYLRDKADTYHEKFTVNLTKLDGSIATISNR